MKYRPFNETGRSVSEVGMGCWQIGGAWGDVPDTDALDALHAAVDSGMTFFDTADVYGSGRSEQLIGRLLADRSEEIFVATKLGRGGPTNYSESDLRGFTEASLGRLGVEAVDLMQLHCIPTEELRRGEVFQALRRIQTEGKIRAFGASVESVAEALLCVDQPGLASLQVIFNIFRQKPATELFERARASGVAIIVRLPLASGLLAGKITAETTFPADDHRSFNEDGQAFNVGETFAGLGKARGAELADALRPFAPEGMTMAQFALRWCLDHEAVTVVIPGARNAEQVRQNAQASELPPLGADLHGRLRDFYAEQVAASIRGPY